MARCRNYYRAVSVVFGADTDVEIMLEATILYKRPDRSDSPWVLGNIQQLASMGFSNIKFLRSIVVDDFGDPVVFDDEEHYGY